MEKFLGKGCGEESTVTAPEEDCSAEITLRKEYLGPDRASSLASYFPLHAFYPKPHFCTCALNTVGPPEAGKGTEKQRD